MWWIIPVYELRGEPEDGGALKVRRSGWGSRLEAWGWSLGGEFCFIRCLNREHKQDWSEQAEEHHWKLPEAENHLQRQSETNAHQITNMDQWLRLSELHSNNRILLSRLNLKSIIQNQTCISLTLILRDSNKKHSQCEHGNAVKELRKRGKSVPKCQNVVTVAWRYS